MIRSGRVFVLCAVLLLGGALSARDYEDILLRDIASNISSYKGKTLSLRLRLKYLDTIFKKVVFYDRKNIDIEFDVEAMLKDKKKKSAFLNLHNGMEYVVTFEVSDVGKMGIMIGDLREFVPLALLELPEGN
ncbi:MAG: hypothetical protein MUC76_06790 [Spirochaetes bacterium]|jgi:hypothetical protein|nr:hypothetical protein [Spirochaetota bacterium]